MMWLSARARLSHSRRWGLRRNGWTAGGRRSTGWRDLWAEGRYYDMILIDWKMPGMDGIETARRIRGIVGPEVTIIIMTAYDWISIEHEAKLAGVNLLMSKPMFKSSLVSAFTRALGKKEEAGTGSTEMPIMILPENVCCW